jgi:hypothetical protein
MEYKSATIMPAYKQGQSMGQICRDNLTVLPLLIRCPMGVSTLILTRCDRKKILNILTKNRKI